MWRIGFRLWTAWQYVRLAVPGGALTVLVYLGQGASVLFWLLLVGTGAMLLGARVVFVRLDRQEPRLPRASLRRWSR
nr:hypothetical protein [Kibdelosporangium sp. MJ126-NF4]CEL16273.1 hypothetical protein [Kibdelosporangium sp. MJ126-NF4]CTQ94197.1 hypothetical protein [Kibdelosporangium sp. MJ126-NF4]